LLNRECKICALERQQVLTGMKKKLTKKMARLTDERRSKVAVTGLYFSVPQDLDVLSCWTIPASM
jgi:hypothetical protein